jgi:hypothetical protein
MRQWLPVSVPALDYKGWHCACIGLEEGDSC